MLDKIKKRILVAEIVYSCVIMRNLGLESEG